MVIWLKLTNHACKNISNLLKCCYNLMNCIDLEYGP